MEQLGSHWTDFHKILYLGIFRKSVEKTGVSLKLDKMAGTLHFLYLAPFFLESKRQNCREIVEKSKTFFLVNYFFFSENRAVYEVIWKIL